VETLLKKFSLRAILANRCNVT